MNYSGYKSEKTFMRYILLLILFLLFSCRDIRHDVQLLREAELLSDSIPKEALTKLQTIKNSKYLPDADQAKYNFLLTQTMLNTGTRPQSDSIISKAIDYYRQTTDSAALFESLFMKGRYFYSFSRHDSALDYFSQAESVIPSGDDINKHYRVQRVSGFSQLYLGDVNKAVNHLKKAVELSWQTKDTLSVIYATMNLAMAQGYDKTNDSSAYTYQNVLQLAQKKADFSIQSYILAQLSNFYASKNEYVKALEYKKQEHTLRVNRKEIPSRNLAQAMLFDKLNMPDSARHYLELAVKGSDNVVADIAYGFLSDWYRNRGMHCEAFHAWQNKEQTTGQLESGISTAKLQHEYQSVKLRNENNELKIKQKEKDIVILIVVTVVLVLAAIAFFFWIQAKRKHDRERFLYRERELNSQNLLLKQQNEISALREKEALIRESLFKRINLFDKIPSLHAEENEHSRIQKFDKIKMTDNDWEELTKSVNEAYPHFTYCLKEEFPKLSDDDIRFCCLLKINVNLQDLSDIYCVTKSAITKRKYRIKTDKLQLTNNATDLDTFLQKHY